MNYFAIFVLLVSVIWVYFDASKLNQKASKLGVTINLMGVAHAGFLDRVLSDVPLHTHKSTDPAEQPISTRRYKNVYKRH